MEHSIVDEIKEKIDIVDFLKSYLDLKPAGKNFKALCPFHREKTPSFMVSPDRQSWHCFGCGLGGDIFTFLMRYENVSFYEALKILAEKANIDFTKYSSYEFSAVQNIYKLNEEAKNFFKNELRKQENKKALDYLISRGLTMETIEEFEIGYAPRKFDNLTIYLANLGYSMEEIIKSGLSFKNERGLIGDRFFGRIMFPLNNSFSKTIGFTGRLLPEFDDGKSGKYINSPESLIFSKAKFLYGLDKTKSFIRLKGALMVEGQMDFLMIYQAGVKNVVATSGTALTSEQLKTIAHLTDKIILSFDNDEAGQAAIERAIDLANGFDFNTKILIWPKGFKDPAEIIDKDKKMFFEIISKPIAAMEFYFNRYLAKKDDLEISELNKRIKIILRKIKAFPSLIERDYWIKKLAEETQFDEQILRGELEKIDSSQETRKTTDELEEMEKLNLPRKDLIAERLLAIVVSNGNFDKLNEVEKYFSPIYSKIFELLKSKKTGSQDPNIDQLIGRIYFESSVGESEGEFELLVKEIIKEYFKEEKRKIVDQLKKVRLENDSAKEEQLLKKFDLLVKEELKYINNNI